MHWLERRLPFADVSIDPAGSPAIASLFVDDPMPGINPMRLHQPHYGHKPEIPNDVLVEFADTVEREGLAGKFSVVPYPLGVGRIDQGLPGVPDELVRAFVATVAERIAPRFDITPELLTHGPAIDPETGYVIGLTEKEWGSGASAADWRLYIRNALQLLTNVGLRPTGITSPWDTAADNEDAYAQGLLAAGAAFGLDVPFYFLHHAATAAEAFPEVRVMTPGREGLPPRAAVSLRMAGWDVLWKTQYGGEADLDPLIGADGEPGIFGGFGDQGAPMVVGTHWQSLYGNGARRAPEVLGELARRLRARYGDRLIWWPASRMARFAAAAHMLEFLRESDGTLVLDAPIALEDADIVLRAAPGHRLTLLDPDLDTAETGDGALRLRGRFVGRVRLARDEVHSQFAV